MGRRGVKLPPGPLLRLPGSVPVEQAEMDGRLVRSEDSVDTALSLGIMGVPVGVAPSVQVLEGEGMLAKGEEEGDPDTLTCMLVGEGSEESLLPGEALDSPPVALAWPETLGTPLALELAQPEAELLCRPALTLPSALGVACDGVAVAGTTVPVPDREIVPLLLSMGDSVPAPTEGVPSTVPTLLALELMLAA